MEALMHQKGDFVTLNLQMRYSPYTQNTLLSLLGPQYPESILSSQTLQIFWVTVHV